MFYIYSINAMISASFLILELITSCHATTDASVMPKKNLSPEPLSCFLKKTMLGKNAMETRPYLQSVANYLYRKNACMWYQCDGAKHYGCEKSNCHCTKVICQSCKTKACSSCGTKSTEQWIAT